MSSEFLFFSLDFGQHLVMPWHLAVIRGPKVYWGSNPGLSHERQTALPTALSLQSGQWVSKECYGRHLRKARPKLQP